MADKRISQLIERTDIANNDVLPIVASGATTTNKVTISTIQDWMQDNLDVGVTSVGITFGTSGTDINASGSPVTSSGNITINIPDASATARGVVSTGTQTFAGAKTFNSDIIVNGVNVGRGGGNISGNVILGSILANNTTGIYNVAINGGALGANTTGRDNVAIGYVSLNSNTTGERNTAVGGESMYDNLTGSENTAIGLQALSNMTTGKWNVSIGNRSATLAGSGGAGLFASNNSIYIGYDSRAGADNQTNQIVIGHNAIGQGSNTVTIGNSSTNLNKLFGRVIHSDAINADESATLGQVNTSLAGYVTLGTAQTITSTKTFTTSGSGNTINVNHTSGSGHGVEITKAGNGEGLRVIKTSGSGNAVTITGGNFSAEAATFSGVVTTTPDAVINGVNVGRGGGNAVENTRLGNSALSVNTTGSGNTAIGYFALPKNTAGGNNTAFGAQTLYENTTGSGNTGLGWASLYYNTTGSNNSALGNLSLYENTTGQTNVGIGFYSLFKNTTGSDNTALGYTSGAYIADGTTSNSISNNSVYIGAYTKALANNQTNQIVIGHNAVGNGSNTVTIGNSSITNNYFTGNIRGGAFIRTGGTSSQFLKADGSVDSSTYLTTGSAASTYYPLTGGILTGGIFIQTAAPSVQLRAANGSNAAFILANSSNTHNWTFESDFGAAGQQGELRIRNSILGSNAINISTSNVVTLTGALNGTSASFSGNVTAAQGNFTSTANNYASASIILRAIGGTNPISLTSVGGFFALSNGGSGDHLLISSTGAATFSSSVTATQGLFSSTVTAGTGTTSGYAVLGLIDPGTGSTRYGSIRKNYDSPFDLRIRASNSESEAPIVFDLSNDTEAMRITSDGNVFAGATSGRGGSFTGHLFKQPTGDTYFELMASSTTSANDILFSSGSTGAYGIVGYDHNDNSMRFFANSSERMRITSGGFLKASNTGTYANSTSSVHEIRSNIAGAALLVSNSNSSFPYGLAIVYNSTPNNNAEFFIECADSTTSRFIVSSNGNVRNTNNSYGAISDIKLKENITDATPKLDDLLKVKIRNYNLIGEETKQIGVIAQELEEVFPAMVSESEDFEEVEVPQLDEEGNEVLNEEGEVVTEKQRVSKGTSTKSVKYSVFVPMLIKAIQELKTEIDSLKNQIK